MSDAPKKVVLSLVKRLNDTKTKMQSISGEIGQEVKEAVENKFLHASALKLIAKLSRMDEEKRNDFLRAFQLYWTYAKEAGLPGAEHAGDLMDNVRPIRPDDEEAAGTYAA